MNLYKVPIPAQNPQGPLDLKEKESSWAKHISFVIKYNECQIIS
jgi:hypothetical protein